MEKSKIHINYFYRVFQSEAQKLMLEKELKTINEKPNETDLSDIMFYTLINRSTSIESRINIYKQVLYKICEDYIVLSNSSIEVYPADVFEFVDLILDTIQENPYKESFVFSLQFIYQEFLDCLKKGSPLLFSSQDENKNSTLEIVLNAGYEILQFDAINLDSVEQDKIMNKLVYMECEHIIGPLPKVAIRVRKDI